MKLQILDMAKNDLVEGFRFYEEKGEGLGDYFLSNLFSDIESLKVFGGIHRKAYKEYYRALSRRFPFAIFYTIGDDTVWIRSIVDWLFGETRKSCLKTRRTEANRTLDFQA